MNVLFSPPAAVVAPARQLLAPNDAAEAQGRGALEFRARMVELPAVLRARELLRRAKSIRAED